MTIEANAPKDRDWPVIIGAIILVAFGFTVFLLVVNAIGKALSVA